MTVEEAKQLQELKVRIHYLSQPLERFNDELVAVQGFKLSIMCDTPGIGMFANNDGTVKNYQDVKNSLTKHINFILNPCNQCQTMLQLFIPFTQDISKFYEQILSIPEFVKEFKRKVNEAFSLFIKVQDALKRFNTRDEYGNFIPTEESITITISNDIPPTN